MLKRRWKIALIAAGSVLLLLLLALPWAIEAAVERQAAARQLALGVETIRLRPGRLWLEQVDLRHKKLPAIRAQLDAVEVRYGFAGVREIIVHGGTLTVSAPPDDVLAQLRALRGDPPPPAAEPRTGRQSMPVRAKGLTLVWPVNEVEDYHVWGLSFARDDRGVRVAADLVRLAHPLAVLEGKRPAVELTRQLQIQQLDSDGIHLALRLDGLSRAGSSQRKVALEEDAAKREGAEQRDGITSEARVDAAGGASGDEAQTEQATERAPLLGLMSLSPERGERWRRIVDRASALLAARIAEQRELRLDELTAQLDGAGQSLNVGPAQVSLRRTSELLDLSFTTGSAGGPGQRLQLEITLPLEEGPLSARLRGGPVRLSQLGVRERDFGLVGVDRMELTVEGDAAWSSSGEQAEFSTKGELRDVAIYHPRLAPAALSGMNVRWSVDGSFALDGSRLQLRSGEVAVGAVASNVNLEVLRQEQQLVVDAKLEVPSASCQAMFDSLPKEAVPLLEGTRLSGKFSWSGALQFDTDRLADAKVRWRMNNGCRIEEVPPQARVRQFRRPFMRQVPGADGTLVESWSGPGSEDWVPRSHISRYMEVAVLVTEDGGFWSHSGFSPRAIESAIRQNLKEGRFVRGASTISMQLAKNLYLSRDKHLSRKVQEALLTMLLEQRLSKEEMLELYFNVIEYGPGIYGIGPAAKLYFSSSPTELSLAQAFYLASLLPNPKHDRFDADGYLKPSWERYLKSLMRIAHERERITEGELEAGLEERLRFGVPHMLSNPYDMMLVEPPPWGEAANENEGF